MAWEWLLALALCSDAGHPPVRPRGGDDYAADAGGAARR